VLKTIISKSTMEFLIKHLVELEEEKAVILKEFFPRVTAKSMEFEAFIGDYIKNIEKVIQSAEVTESGDIHIPIVLINSIVEIEDFYEKEVDTIQIVSPFYNKMVTNYYFASYLSPIGRALLMKKKGDKVSVKTPSGISYYIVRSIAFP